MPKYIEFENEVIEFDDNVGDNEILQFLEAQSSPTSTPVTVQEQSGVFSKEALSRIPASMGHGTLKMAAEVPQLIINPEEAHKAKQMFGETAGGLVESASDWLREKSKGQGEEIQKLMQGLTPEAQAVVGGAASITPSLAGLAIGRFSPTAGLAIASGTLGASKYVTSYDEALEKTQDSSLANKIALWKTVAEVVPETIGLNKIMKLGGPWVKRVLAAAGINATEEMITGLLEDAGDMVALNEKITLGQFVQSRYLEGIAGGFWGGAMGTITAGQAEAGPPAPIASPYDKLRSQIPEIKNMDDAQVVEWLEQQDKKAGKDFLEKAWQQDLIPEIQEAHVLARENIPTPIDPRQRDLFETPVVDTGLDTSEKTVIDPVTNKEFRQVVQEWREEQRQSQLELLPDSDMDAIPFKSVKDTFREYLIHMSPSVLEVVLDNPRLQGMLEEITALRQKLQDYKISIEQRRANIQKVYTEKGGISRTETYLPESPPKTPGVELATPKNKDSVTQRELDVYDDQSNIYSDMLRLMMSDFHKAAMEERLSTYDFEIIAKALDLPSSSVEGVLSKGAVEALKIEKTKTTAERRWENPWFPSELKIEKTKTAEEMRQVSENLNRAQKYPPKLRPSNVDAKLEKMINDKSDLSDLLDVIHRESNLPKSYRLFAFLLNSKLTLMPDVVFGTQSAYDKHYFGEKTAEYSPSKHKITIYNTSELAATILHESVHVLTSKVLIKFNQYDGMSKKGRERLEQEIPNFAARYEIYAQLKALQALLKEKFGKSYEYELSNVEEMMSGIVAEGHFQKAMKEVTVGGLLKDAETGKYGKVVTDWLFNKLRHLLGFHNAMDATIFSGILELTTQFVNQSTYADMMLKVPGSYAMNQMSKVDVQQIKAALPPGMQHLASRLAATMGAVPINTPAHNTTSVWLSKNPTWKTAIQDFMPDNRTYDEVSKEFDELLDISGGLREKMGQQLVGGGKMYSWIKKHPALKWGVDKIDGARRRTEIRVNEALFNAKDGVLTKWNKLTGDEQGKLWEVILENHRVRDLTTQDLLNYNLNPAQIEAYKTTQTHFKNVLTAINARRVAAGQPPVKSVPGYWPSRWDGAYYITIRSPQGTLLSVETADTKRALDALGEHLTNQGYEVSPVERKQHKLDYKDHFDVFSKVVETLGSNSTEAKALHTAINKYSHELADRRLYLRRHFKPAAGIGGFKGARHDQLPGTKEAAQDALEGLRGYFKDAYDWLETKSMMSDIGKFLAERDEKALRLKNVKKYLRQYLQNSLDIETKFTHLFNEVAGIVPEALGYSPDTPKQVVQGMKKFGLIYLLAFWRPTFLAAQFIQPSQFMPSMLQHLQANVPDINKSWLSAQAKGYSSAIQAVTEADKLTGWEKEAHKYALENRVVVPHFLEDVYDVGSLKRHEVRKLLTGEKGIEYLETLGRTIAFFQAAHMLRNTDMPNDIAFTMAAEMADLAMVNYRRHERPLIYRQFGILGDMASALTTFKHNYFSQMYKYGKELAKNPTEVRKHQAFYTHLVLQFAVAGMMGLPFVGDLDWLIKLLRESFNFATKWKTPSEFMLEKSASLPDWGKNTLRHGVWSGISGWDVSPSLAAGNLLPDQGLSSLFIVPGAAIDLFGDFYPAMSAPFSGRSPSKPELSRAAMAMPGIAKPFGEMYAQDPETGIVPDPRRHMKGEFRRSLDHTSNEWYARIAGARTNAESEERRTKYAELSRTNALNLAKKRITGAAIDKAVGGLDFSEELAKYVEMGGDPNVLIRQVEEALIANKTTHEERLGMGTNGLSGVQRYLLYQMIRRNQE